MARKRARITRDPFRLNEPSRRIPGGSRRASVLIRDAAFANIRERERLYDLLLRHEPDGPSREFTAHELMLLRQIATEGPLTNHVPALRRSAILSLATLPTPDNLEALTELALAGEDFYIRSYALLALGETGLKVAAPLLRDALAAEESTERQAAEVALRSVARRHGHAVLIALRERERNDATRVCLNRILESMNEQRPKRRPAPRVTSRRT